MISKLWVHIIITTTLTIRQSCSCAELSKHYAMREYEEVHVQIHIFLTSAPVGGEWSASRLGRFTPGTHWIGGWVDPRAGLHDKK
jgi:hypothetical protein